MQLRTTARRIAALTRPVLLAGAVELASAEAPQARDAEEPERCERTLCTTAGSGFMVAVG